jgi:hypothetical protein
MATTLTQGTKEYLLVDLTDAAGELTALTGTNPRFTVVSDNQAATVKYDEAAAVIDGSVAMRVRCLVDTSSAHAQGLWPAGQYKLYVRLDTLPEVPRVGPFSFTVAA